ncbi:ATP synthase D chain [Striga asiatica]|uniref:ATP synthase D chain n=1 Tax=Striga asiatica TaxID=4170 RepID=A0A5A7PS74_STRAF|nr:ATP synthase D chain [Striga asiatica]
MVDAVRMDTVQGREIRLLSTRRRRYVSWSLEASTEELPYNEICRAFDEVRLQFPHQSRHSPEGREFGQDPRDLCGPHSRRGWLFRQIPDGFDIADLMELPEATSEVPNSQKAKTRFILLRPLQPRPCRRELPGIG